MPDTPEAESDVPFHHPPLLRDHIDIEGDVRNPMSRMVLNPTFISDPPGSLFGVPETFAELVYLCFGIRYAGGNLLDASCNGEELIRVSTDGGVFVRGEEVARITRDDIVRAMAKNGITI